MTAKLTIQFSDEVLDALRKVGSITIQLASKEGAVGAAPREGSLPARILTWAEKRKRPFGTSDVAKRFKLSRAHASMTLSKLANGPYPVRRVRRGVYEYAASGRTRTR